jgi:hypothetical protein
VVYALVLGLMGVVGALSAYNAGAWFAPVVLPWLAISTIAFVTWRRSWGWDAYIGWYLLLFFALAALSVLGRLSA